MPATPFWRIPSLWISLALGAGLALSVQQAWRHLVRPDLDERPALAVLPFANLSPDPANAYFADGLHEEVLATLARAGGLRVISRTSVQEFRDSKRNLKEIADALGVSLILEGSVRRSGDDLRLTLQLIDGRTDEHLWTETYDRKFRESLDLQQSIAGQVVAAIGATLSPAEQRLIDRATPTVPEAYDAYLHALALASQYATEAEFGVVLALLDRSIGLDPTFAPAYALRAKTRIWFHAVFGLEDMTLTDAASGDIERALELRARPAGSTGRPGTVSHLCRTGSGARARGPVARARGRAERCRYAQRCRLDAAASRPIRRGDCAFHRSRAVGTRRRALRFPGCPDADLARAS